MTDTQWKLNLMLLGLFFATPSNMSNKKYLLRTILTLIQIHLLHWSGSHLHDPPHKKSENSSAPFHFNGEKCLSGLR